MQSIDKEKQIRIIATSLSSSFAGMIGKLVVHPIDTIKAQIQIDSSHLTLKDYYKQNFIIETIKLTFQNEGIRGFFKGVGFSVIGTGPAYSLYMTAYQISKIQLFEYDYFISLSKFFLQHKSITFFTGGMVAQLVSCILWLPIDVVKERMQVQSTLKLYNYKNSIDAIFTMIKTEGFWSLYRAFGATLGSYGPWSALYFLCYENFKCRFNTIFIPLYFSSFFKIISATYSGLAGAIAGILTNPLGMAKLRMQIERKIQLTPGNLGKVRFGYQNMMHGVYLIYQNQGFFSLFKGSLAKILMSVPVSAINMSLTEKIRVKLINQMNE